MASQKWTAAQFIEAIQGTGGIKITIARKLGCHRHTVTRYIDKYSTIKQSFENERERMVDLAEGKFMKLVEAGEWPAIRFMLMTLGASRGYAPKSELDLKSGGNPLTFEVHYVNPPPPLDEADES